MTTASDLLTVDEVVPIVRLHRVTVYRLARQGVIESVQQGRKRLFRRAAIDAYLDRCTVPASADSAPQPAPQRPSRNPARAYKT
jgi:excisionase family DNA binding protein